MRKETTILALVFSFIFLIFISAPISAEIIFNSQLNKVYNLGDSISLSATVKALNGKTGIFYMDLICNGQSINFYKNGLSLNAGEEKKIEASLIFKKELLGETKGECLIKGIFGAEYALTQEFTLSNNLNITLETEQTEFKPGESAVIKGKVMEENGQGADGFINLNIGNEENLISQSGTVDNGFFSVNISFPKDIEAKKYLLRLDAYEKESEEVQTNTGYIISSIAIVQVPTNLEAIVEEKAAEPGTNVHIKGILHDQTGKNIDAPLTILIKNNKTKIVGQFEKQTDEVLDFPIKYDEKPLTWSIEIKSNELIDKSTFLVAEKKQVKTSLINNTVTITNVGNVFYNDSVSVKISGETLFIDVALDVGESKEYKLTAPDGEYEVVILKEGEDAEQYRTFLTGSAVSATEKGFKSKTFFSFAWIFILLVLLIIAYLFLKKTRKKTFFGYMPVFRNEVKKAAVLSQPLISKSKAEVSLSIAGDKQSSTLACLNIKNSAEIEKTKGNAKETIQKIIDFAESKKTIIYKTPDYLFFILAPSKTKTFRNEKTAMQIAELAKKTLTEHNKLFKQKINFGISINNGEIIMKQEKDSAKFTSMGTFISSAKKMAGISQGEILFSGQVKDKLASEIKSEKLKDHDNVYSLREVKKYSEEHKKFLDRFVKGLGSE